MSEKPKKVCYRETPLVIRCPHCGKTLRIRIALVEKEREEE